MASRLIARRQQPKKATTLVSKQTLEQAVQKANILIEQLTGTNVHDARLDQLEEAVSFLTSILKKSPTDMQQEGAATLDDYLDDAVMPDMAQKIKQDVDMIAKMKNSNEYEGEEFTQEQLEDLEGGTPFSTVRNTASSTDFISDRDEKGEPKAPELAEVPRLAAKINNNWKAPSGLIGWKARLRDNYDNDFEQFQGYNDTYGIAERLGFDTAEAAWDANPMIGGSVMPSDLKVIQASKGKKATGEMYSVDPQEYSTHFAIAKALGGEVKPFDTYQGPYIAIGGDLRVGNAPYAMAPRMKGIVRLWITSDAGGLCSVYNEDNEKTSSIKFPYEDEDSAIEAAREVAATRNVTSDDNMDTNLPPMNDQKRIGSKNVDLFYGTSAIYGMANELEDSRRYCKNCERAVGNHTTAQVQKCHKELFGPDAEDSALSPVRASGLSGAKKAAPVLQMPAKPKSPAAPASKPSADITQLSSDTLAKMQKALAGSEDLMNDKAAQAFIAAIAEELMNRPVEVEQEQTPVAPAGAGGGAAAMPLAASFGGLNIVSAETKVAVTPPGISEELMHKLKKEYPGDKERAYATAWSIHNDKSAALRVLNAAAKAANGQGGSWFVTDKDTGTIKEDGGRTPEVAEAHSKLEDNTGIPHPATELPSKFASFLPEVFEGIKTLINDTEPTKQQWSRLEQLADFIIGKRDKNEGLKLESESEFNQMASKAAASDFPPEPDSGRSADYQEGYRDGYNAAPKRGSVNKSAGDMTTGKAVKTVERLGNELKSLYFEAKPVTEILDSRPVREAVEAIYRAYDMMGEAGKVLNKQHMQEEAEEQAFEIKEKNKKKSSTLFGLILAANEDDKDEICNECGYSACECDIDNPPKKNSR